MDKQKIVKQINEIIAYGGSGLGPSSVRLLRHMPVHDIVYPEHEQILKEYEESIISSYNVKIIPKLKYAVAVLTENQANFPKSRQDLESKFKVQPWEYTREILARSYDALSDAEKSEMNLDEATLEALMSRREIPNKNTFVRSYYDSENNYLLFDRLKEDNSSNGKYLRIWEHVLTDEDRSRFLYFLLDVIGSKNETWRNDERERLALLYGSNLPRTYLGDYHASTIVDLQYSRGKAAYERLSKLGPDIQIPGFNIIKDRYDDHTLRREMYKKPGGLHYTVVDAGLINFPAEIQVMQLVDRILYDFGPFNHWEWTRNGKSKIVSVPCGK